MLISGLIWTSFPRRTKELESGVSNGRGVRYHSSNRLLQTHLKRSIFAKIFSLCFSFQSTRKKHIHRILSWPELEERVQKFIEIFGLFVYGGGDKWMVGVGKCEKKYGYLVDICMIFENLKVITVNRLWVNCLVFWSKTFVYFWG